MPNVFPLFPEFSKEGHRLECKGVYRGYSIVVDYDRDDDKFLWMVSSSEESGDFSSDTSTESSILAAIDLINDAVDNGAKIGY